MAKRVVRKKKTPTQQIENLRECFVEYQLKSQAEAKVQEEIIDLLKASVAKLETRVYALEESVSLKKVREGLTNDQRIMQANPHIALAL